MGVQSSPDRLDQVPQAGPGRPDERHPFPGRRKRIEVALSGPAPVGAVDSDHRHWAAPLLARPQTGQHLAGAGQWPAAGVARRCSGALPTFPIGLQMVESRSSGASRRVRPQRCPGQQTRSMTDIQLRRKVPRVDGRLDHTRTLRPFGVVQPVSLVPRVLPARSPRSQGDGDEFPQAQVWAIFSGIGHQAVVVDADAVGIVWRTDPKPLSRRSTLCLLRAVPKAVPVPGFGPRQHEVTDCYESRPHAVS